MKFILVNQFFSTNNFSSNIKISENWFWKSTCLRKFVFLRQKSTLIAKHDVVRLARSCVRAGQCPLETEMRAQTQNGGNSSKFMVEIIEYVIIHCSGPENFKMIWAFKAKGAHNSAPKYCTILSTLMRAPWTGVVKVDFRLYGDLTHAMVYVCLDFEKLMRVKDCSWVGMLELTERK